jgi:hypothetical protein
MQAFARTGPVTEGVAQAVDRFHWVPGDVVQDGVQGFQVAVDVTFHPLDLVTPGAS